MSPRSLRYAVVFSPEVLEHLAAIERKYHSMLAAVLDEQLTVHPDRETRNRKPLARSKKQAILWELRCGPGNRLRVFYEVQAETRTVLVLAVARKIGNRLFIGREEIEL